MKIAIHDFGGHPFTMQLAGALAKRGFQVAYFFTSACGTPNAGNMDGAEKVKVVDVKFPPFRKDKFVIRKLQEMRYGHKAVKEIAKWKPDVLISSTAPVDSEITISKWAKKHHVKHIFWFQDIISHAAQKILTEKLGKIGTVIAKSLARTEKKIVTSADFVVNISEPFEEQCLAWNIPKEKMMIQSNWPVIDELPLRSKANEWAKKYHLHHKFVFLYTGTLGFKNHPEKILHLAQKFEHDKHVKIVVVSSTMGAQWLKVKKDKHHLENLLILPFQPFSDLPDVMASADVLLTTQTYDAGKYAVPSKVLSYLCAGRAQLLTIDSENQAARMVLEANAGRVVCPSADEEFVEAAVELYHNKKYCKEAGKRAREFAESHFDVEAIEEKFEEVLRKVAK